MDRLTPEFRKMITDLFRDGIDVAVVQTKTDKYPVVGIVHNGMEITFDVVEVRNVD